MQTRNVGFGAITAGAVRKGMILRDKLDTEIKVLDTKNVNRHEKEIRLQFFYEKGRHLAEYLNTCNKMDKLDFDLVGWVKKAVKPKKSV